MRTQRPKAWASERSARTDAKEHTSVSAELGGRKCLGDQRSSRQWLCLARFRCAGAVCTHMENGLVHRAGDVKTLAEHITLLHKDRALLEELRASSLRTLHEITWGAAAEKFLPPIARLLSRLPQQLPANFGSSNFLVANCCDGSALCSEPITGCEIRGFGHIGRVLFRNSRRPEKLSRPGTFSFHARPGPFLRRNIGNLGSCA